MDILITSVVDITRAQHNRIHQLVRYLSKKNNITLITFRDTWKEKQHNVIEYIKDWEQILEKIELFHITDKRIPPFVQESFLSYFFIKKFLKKNHDFNVHLNHGSLGLGYFATNYGLDMNIPTVFDFFDDFIAMIRESPQIPSFLRPVGTRIGEKYLKANIRLSKKVIVTTPALKARFNIPNEKVTIIPNGVDTKLVKNYGDTKSQFGLEDHFVIGYVGVLREWVDFEPIYRALRELPDDIIFLVVGKEGRYQENIELAKKYGVIEKVMFVGNVPYSKVPIYISAMDVGVIPFKLNSITEHALPLKLFEYMACEKPVISVPIPPVITIFKDSNGILYAQTKEEFKTAILKIYNNQELFRDIGKENRKIISEKFDWEVLTKKLQAILEEVSR